MEEKNDLDDSYLLIFIFQVDQSELKKDEVRLLV